MASRRCLIDSFDNSSSISRAVEVLKLRALNGASSPSDGTGRLSTTSDSELDLVAKRIKILKRIFHSERKLQVHHPNQVLTEKDIRDILSDYSVSAVQLQHIMGTSFALTQPPEDLEDFDKDRLMVFNGSDVLIRKTLTDHLLCIAHMPLSLTESQFASLVKSHGTVKWSFLMINEKTGASKGYGFVKYEDRMFGDKAKILINGKPLDGSNLFCDWLEPLLTKFEALHSKCIYVDKLPKGFRNMEELRQLISTIAPPTYCQIALKNGMPQSWAVVELNSSKDAEQVQEFLDGFWLHGERIRARFSAPGLRAINLYEKILCNNETVDKDSGLLPTPTPSSVLQHFQTFEKQNPMFAQSVRNILITNGIIQNSVAPLVHASKSSRPFAPVSRDPTPLSCITSHTNHINSMVPNVSIPQYMEKKEEWKKPPPQVQQTFGNPLSPKSLLPALIPKMLLGENITMSQSIPPQLPKAPPQFPSHSYWSPPKASVNSFKPSSEPDASDNGLFGWGPSHHLIAQTGLLSPIQRPVVKLAASPTSPPFTGPAPSCVTPIGQKRKNDLHLPSPEPSPEGNYIGQHSQGLGGHYADSYRKRMKKF